jgi:hypothetical protein
MPSSNYYAPSSFYMPSSYGNDFIDVDDYAEFTSDDDFESVIPDVIDSGKIFKFGEWISSQYNTSTGSGDSFGPDVAYFAMIDTIIGVGGKNLFEKGTIDKNDKEIKSRSFKGDFSKLCPQDSSSSAVEFGI